MSVVQHWGYSDNVIRLLEEVQHGDACRTGGCSGRGGACSGKAAESKTRCGAPCAANLPRARHAFALVVSFSSDATAAALTSLELPFAIPRARSLEPLASRPKAPARTLASCAAFSAAPPGAINGGLWRQGRRRTPGGSCRADRHLMTSPESSRRAVSTSASTVDRHPDVLTRRNKVGLPRSAWRLRLSSGCFLAMSCNYGPMDALVSASVPECNCRNNTQKKKRP